MYRRRRLMKILLLLLLFTLHLIDAKYNKVYHAARERSVHRRRKDEAREKDGRENGGQHGKCQ